MIHRSSSETNSYEILCLEHQGQYLYAEVIQVVAMRQRYWVRPLLLRIDQPTTADHPDYPAVQSLTHDLKSASDLVWPQLFFRPTLDTELLPLISQIQRDKASEVGDSEAAAECDRQAKQALRQLIEQVWQAFPEAFST
ncbi:MAG: hypothetical protein HC934_00500 [Acaryochloridaceae cyanobacterium SU_2_1]|nr:hypothetical protein [Acaryochloridaceae cyanobacterium SU_2_1]